MTETKLAVSLNETSAIARWIINQVGNGIILFNGDMGAGKTTLIKAICKELEVEDEVSSPTYSLVNEYFSPSAGTIYHFDFYRLRQEEEAMDMGVEEYLDSGKLCLLEWPENICNLLPDDCAVVNIRVNGEKRDFELKINRNE
tara:strand:+ start:1384 stop:1812 length:429 start_codon:yes stop_codon:yes gene_type:complete